MASFQRDVKNQEFTLTQEMKNLKNILWVMGNRRMRKPEEVVDEKLGEAGMIKQNLT